MEYFLVYGVMGILFLLSIGIIIRLIYQLSELKYEMKLGKINCQKDLDRIEDRINQIINKDNNHYAKEIEKLDKLNKTLSRLVDTNLSQMESTKKLLND